MRGFTILQTRPYGFFMLPIDILHLPVTMKFLKFYYQSFVLSLKNISKGTSYGIKVDEDGLLIQGDPDYPLTWMDAKLGDWIVTPRRGKAVEINALWYNALRLFELWSGEKTEVADRCFESFNKRFWNPTKKYLFDVVDGEKGDDPSLRPNQLFSISLDYPVLKEDYWKSVVDAVKKDLLTPFGLRTLSPQYSEF